MPVDEEIEDEEEESEDEPERTHSIVPKRVVSRASSASSGGSARSSGKGSLMSIIAKLKKVHPAYWVLGLGGAALAVDYFVEGDQSVASSLYRGVFGSGRSGGGGGGGSGGGVRAQMGIPGGRVMPIPAMGYPQPEYYPAYPYHAPYDAYAAYHHGHRYPGYPGFGHWGMRRQTMGHGGMGRHEGMNHFGHAHVRGEYSWE